MKYPLHPSGRSASRRGSVFLFGVVALSACAPGVESLSSMQEDVTGILSSVEAPATAEAPVIAVGAGFRQALLGAVRSNQGYLAALASERQALDRIGVAESARRPQFGVNGTAGAFRENGSREGTETGAAANVTLSQLLFDGGEAVAGINQATAEALVAQADREVTANELALEAARAWIDVWQYRERIALLRSRTTEMREILSQIERMAQNGMLDRSMLEDARRQIVTVDLEESRMRADLASAQVRFQRFFRVPDAGVNRPEAIISMARARQEAGRWEQAPSLRRAAGELIIARSAVSAAEAAFSPRARLQAGVNSPLDPDDAVDTSVGLTFEYTFGDGGRRRAQLAAAEARLEAATAQVSDRQQTLRAELDATVRQLAEIERAMPLLQENIRLSRSTAETARSQIATGQSNLRQLVDAEIDSYRASDQHIAMQAERMVLQLTIAARTGALAREIGLEPAATPSSTPE
jgi:outer membrane protein, adhesin transport system